MSMSIKTFLKGKKKVIYITYVNIPKQFVYN